MDTRTRKKTIYNLNSEKDEPHLEPRGLLTSHQHDEDVLSDDEKPIIKEFLEYEASADDTIASIAAVNKTTVSELMRINKLISPLIHPGQWIRIPKQSLSRNDVTLLQGASSDNYNENIKERFDKPSLVKQRSISEYHRPKQELLTIPENKKIVKKTRSRKNSLAVLFESVVNKFNRPLSHENVAIQLTKQRAKSVAVRPKLRYLEFGDEKKERKLSETKQKPPEPVSFLSEIVFPDEENSTGTFELNGERLIFESDSQTNFSNYIYYSIKYDDILNTGLWKSKENSKESFNFMNPDHLDLMEMKMELQNIDTNVEDQGVSNPSDEIRDTKYFLSAQMTSDNPYFLDEDKDFTILWFSLVAKKIIDIDQHLSIVLPHCYINLPEQVKIELLYDLNIKLLRGEFSDVNQNGLLNASVKFKVEKTTIFKSKIVQGGLKPIWKESFRVENMSPVDNIRIKIYHGSTTIGHSLISLSIIPHKVNKTFTLDVERIDESQPLKIGYIHLECLLLPKGSPTKLPPVPHPHLHPCSQIISKFHVAKLSDSLPSLMTSSQNWRIIYSNLDHGSSLTTLYWKMGECSSDDCIVLVIKDSEQKVFGAYLTSPIKPSKNSYGTGECFLFTFYPFFQKFGWAGENTCFVRSDESGISIGSGKAGDGLWIFENILDGCTHVSETFNNFPLTPEKTFQIHAIETWKIEV